MESIPLQCLCQFQMLMVERGHPLFAVNPITSKVAKPAKKNKKQKKKETSLVTVQGGRTDIYGQIAPVFSEYIAPQPPACYATSVPLAFAAPAPVVEPISRDFAGYAEPVPVVESSRVAPASVVEYVSPDPAEYVATACVVKYISAETAVSNAAPVPTVVAEPGSAEKPTKNQKPNEEETTIERGRPVVCC